MVSKQKQKIGEVNGMPNLPTGPHRSQKREIWVLWTFLGWAIYPHLALGGRVLQ